MRQRQAFTGATFEAGQGLRIDLDLRRLDWRQRLGLPSGTLIHWEKVRTTDVKELSCFLTPVFYRVTFGDGWYIPSPGGSKVYFGVQKHLVGLDVHRQVTTAALRAAVLLAVMAGIGLRGICWLLRGLFHLEVSKSSLARWLQETASQLPDKELRLKLLLADKPVHQGHLDEIFPCGWGSSCVLVLKDEHGRILWAEQIAERTADQVAGILHKLRELGLHVRTFYVDGCEAYRDAITAIYPEAVIQYDYFHIVQNIWKKLWRTMVAHRKLLKERAARSQTPWYSQKLETLAKRLWEQRGLLFKNPDRLTTAESQTLVDLLEQDDAAATVRTFLLRVWGIFRDSQGSLGARQRLGRLKQCPQVQKDPCSAFAKAVAFVEERFEDMTAFLRHPGVQRNSLAESGIRILRRLEQGHDGFRGEQGRDN
ncbi:MAG TPA: transposase, partial [Chloroflexota bacterium]|nr:transposase [Chloroflexota bacterium]